MATVHCRRRAFQKNWATNVDDRIRKVIRSAPNWYHRIELAPGVFTPGANDSGKFLALLELPHDLSGKRVLDLGTRDGYFAFEAERRGAAEIIAIDYVDKSATGFAAVADYFGSSVRYIRENIWNLDPAVIGTFDIVLFLGLLYHLRNPSGRLISCARCATTACTSKRKR
jgi:tRNA (mo5U34)-methyltransferase